MRFLPPVYSPLGFGAIARATTSVVTGGAAVAILERRLSERFVAPTVVATGSGTQALQLALGLAPPSGSGKAVVAMPAYSCFDLVTAAVGAGVGVRFYDVDPLTLSPDMDSLRTVLTEGVTAVVASCLYGYPVDWPAIRHECSGRRLLLIEDAAQGVGTVVREHRGGQSGDVTVLSFGRGKGWTGGGGGALLVRGDGVASRLGARLDSAGFGAALRRGGVTSAAWALGRPALYGLPASIPQLGLGETTYHDPSEPVAMTGFSAGLALATESRSLAAAAERRSTALEWLSTLATTGDGRLEVERCEPIGGPSASTFLRLPILLRDADQAAKLHGAARRFGVARGYPVPLHRLPESRQVMDGPGHELPGADRLASSLITLPTHHWVDSADMAGVIACMRRSSM